MPQKKHNDNWVKPGECYHRVYFMYKQVSNAMSHSWDYDAIVIGSGPGGEGAAMGLVKQGARVAVIEALS